MSTALLVIDVQQQLIEELAPQRGAEYLATLAALLADARKSGTPLVYVRHDGSPEELVPGTPGWEIAAAIAPRPGEPIVDKRYRDAFRETNLDQVLSGLGVDQVIVCGMQSEFCVDATLREAERRGYRVTLVADGHATSAGGGLSEEQIRNHVHRVADGRVAEIVPAAELFRTAAAG